MTEVVIPDAVSWAVIFAKPSKIEPHWANLFTHKDFGHCYLIREMAGGALIIDPLSWGIYTHFEPKPFDEVVAFHAKHATACLMYVADYRLNTYAIGRSFYSCVNSIKAILGLRKGILVQTPKMLYKYLLVKRGASVIKPWSPWVKDNEE